MPFAWSGLDLEDATIERSAVYTFHSVIAEGWRRGRLHDLSGVPFVVRVHERHRQ